MSTVSIPKRQVVLAIAGSIEELDSLARKISDLIGTGDTPRWTLRVPGFQPITARGSLADIGDALSLDRLRGFDLWIGNSWDIRHATVSVDAAGIRADVWGESETWAKESASRVRHYLDELRPWWWWLRGQRGYWISTILINALALAVLGLISIATDTSTSGAPTTVAILTGSVLAVIITLFFVPKLRIGPRVPTAQVVGRLALWGLGALVTTVGSAYVALSLSTP